MSYPPFYSVEASHGVFGGQRGHIGVERVAVCAAALTCQMIPASFSSACLSADSPNNSP
jgi:hypothetical protein